MDISPLLSRKEVTQEIIFPNYKELKMSLRINNNVEAMNAHRNLAQNDKMLAKSIERLSSGQKINRGGDGPASLVISEGLRAQVASLQQAAENNESAISMVQTAEGALNEVSRLLVDIRQRAVAAANTGVNDNNMVIATQKEIENALDTIDRISKNTRFADRNLLDGSNSGTFQIGTFQDTPENQIATARGQINSQTASIALPNVATNELAKGVQNNSGFASLADIDVTAEGGAQSAMAVVDQAISEVTTHRGNLGAFQKNTLESNLTSLRVATENLTAAESNIRDADVAVELAAFTRNQIMTQSATAQVAQANAMSQNVARLLSAQ
jgi:flagellin